MATASIPKGFKLVPTDDDEKTPEARGKAAALSVYLARKGSPKGNRLDRHVAKFEQMWAKAPVAVKEKYASRSQKTDLAPSERNGPPIQGPTNASLNASKPGETAAQTQARFREARMGKVPVPVATPGQDFAAMTQNPVGGFKSVGDDSSPEAEAKRQGRPPINPALENAFPGIQDPNYKAPAPAPARVIPANQTAAINQAFSGIQAQSAPPIKHDGGKAYSDEHSESYLNAAAKGEKSPTREEAGKPFKDPGLAPGDNYEAEEAVRRTNNAKIEADNAKEGLSPLGGAATPPSATPAAPVAGTPPVAGPAASTRVNSLTGLPFGFRPGDAVAPGQKMLADASVKRQMDARPVAPIAGPSDTPRGPASQPAHTDSAIAPIAPPRANDPDIIRKDNAAAAKYQANFGNDSSDKDFDTSKNAQKKLYDGASSLDQAKLAANTMRRQLPFTQTTGAPKAKVVAPARRPVLAR